MGRPKSDAATRTFRTLLEQMIWERRQTLQEFVDYAEVFAREHSEPGTIGVRHLQRLIAGRRPNGEPLRPVQPVTARLLERIFDVSIDDLLAEPRPSEVAERSRPGRDEIELAAVLDWLDDRAGWPPRTSRTKVRAQLVGLDQGDMLDHGARRARVGRAELASALTSYYGDSSVYRATCAGTTIVTSIETRSDWLDLNCPLNGVSDRFTLVDEPYGRDPLGDITASAAVSRLAESAALGGRFANLPLYRLLSVDISQEQVHGRVSVVPFAEYALTADLLERELVDAVAGQAVAGQKPLRDKHLPNLDSVHRLSDRVCAGGVAALCAIARPRDQFHGARDFALLIQERSGQVLNATGRLAVIPKGFHQPLTDVRAETSIGATLRRELEEELFGRSDVDATVGNGRLAAPMHPGRWSEPMRWLSEDPARLRTECTGFGLNLMSGNYEFASLVVIDDEEFWTRYGGQIEANWEAAGLRLYSSLDTDLLTDLITQESWSNEGLFALLQGLRRLSEVGGDRVALPPIRSVTASGPS
jgi:hypothetical protein